MSNDQCMMFYAQGSSVQTATTSVLECRKETPDRLAVCTVERTVTQVTSHRRENYQHNRTTTTTGCTGRKGDHGGVGGWVGGRVVATLDHILGIYWDNGKDNGHCNNGVI